MEASKPTMSLQQLLAEPKGKTTYHPDQAFVLHVFWEAPSMKAAETVLQSLKRCGEATHRDTPCVPTYHFRISSLNSSSSSSIGGGSSKPRTVGQHAQLQDALRKLQLGVPRLAVLADLARRGIGAHLLDASPDTPLPEALQQEPVMLELTEVYLDERAFYEHAGSRDYLDAYGAVMQPGLMDRQATVRLGTPTLDIADKILDPMLKAKCEPVPAGCHVWRAPGTAAAGNGVFLSMDAAASADSVVRGLPVALRESSTTCLAFAHPFDQQRTRVICVLPELPSVDTLRGVSEGLVEGVEVYCQEKQVDVLGEMVTAAKLERLVVVRATQSGYALHEKAAVVAVQTPASD
jgi:GNAT superfamily N-acetyltransferase